MSEGERHSANHVVNMLWRLINAAYVYAKTQEEIVPDGQIKQRDGNFIYFRTLDLNTDFETIKKRLDSFIIR